MTQVATYQVPAHPSGLDMRTQLNAIVLALIGDSAGPTAPTETYPGMWWGDTTAKLLKRRTNANDAWTTVGPLDDFLADIRTAANSANTNANNKVAKAGDTMMGGLVIDSAPGNVISNYLMLRVAGGYSVSMRANTQVPGMEWINSANNAAILTLNNNGTVAVANELSSGGSMYSGRSVRAAGNDTQGVFHSTGELGGGFADWVNQRPYALQVDTWSPAAAYGGIRWTRWGARHIAGIDGYEGGTSTTACSIVFNIGVTPAAWFFNETDIVRNGRGGTVYGTWNLNVGAYASAGAQVQWASGTNDFGVMSSGSVLPAPWVCVGGVGPGNATANAIHQYGVWLRNQ